MPWSSRFEDAVKLPDGTILRTLKDARDHLPDDSPAQKELAKAAEHGGPFLMMARMSVMRALYDEPAKPTISKKEREAAEWKAKRAAAKVRAPRSPYGAKLRKR